MDKKLFAFNVREIAEIAILCAVAIVLDKYVKIPVGATGGSLNFSVAILFVVALRHGWFKGLIAGGVVFGIITCILDDYGIATYPLEYFMAFGSVAILGLFAKTINRKFNEDGVNGKVFAYILLVVGVLAQVVIRYFCATFDSMILYAEYLEGPLFKAALIYNIYVLITGALDLAVVIVLFPVVEMLNKRFKTEYLK